MVMFKAIFEKELAFAAKGESKRIEKTNRQSSQIQFRKSTAQQQFDFHGEF